MLEVTEVEADSRFVVTVDGQPAGFLEYEIDGDVFVALHTEVDPAFRGRGLAEALTREVLDRVEVSGRRLRALCPYVRRFVAEHPSYQHLLRARPARADQSGDGAPTPPVADEGPEG